MGGVLLVLRGLIDIVLDEEQRVTLERHLSMTVAGEPRRSRSLVIDTLLD